MRLADPVLEPARMCDAGALADLRDEAARWLLARGHHQWMVGEYTAEQFARSIERDEVLVTRDADRLVATVTLSTEDEFVWAGRHRPDAAYVHRLVVARSHSGHGWGGAILAAVEHGAQCRGMNVMRLDYVTANRDLGDLYQRLGYREVGRWEPPRRSEGSGRRTSDLPANADVLPCTLMEKQLTRKAADHQ